MNTLAINCDFRIRLLCAVALIATAAIFLLAVPAAAQESATAPGAPASLVLAPGNARLAAGWNQPENDGGAEITGYTVQYKASAASGWVDAGHSGTGTDVEITGLTNDVAYDVRVRASNSAGDGQWSAAASATPLEDILWAAILTASFDSGSNYFGCGINDDYRCSAALTENEFQFEDKTWRWTYFKDGVPEERANGSQLILNPYFSTRLYSTTSDYSSRSVPTDSGLRKAYLQVGSTGVAFNLGDPDSVHWHPDGLGFSLLDESANGGFGWVEGQRVPLNLQATVSQKTGDGTDDKTDTGPTGAPAPGAPVGLAVAPGNAKLVAGWNPPAGDAATTSYTVQYKHSIAPDRPAEFSDPASGWVTASDNATGATAVTVEAFDTQGMTGITGATAEITGLTNDVAYDVRVRASNSAGDGPWSATASAIPLEDILWAAILTADVSKYNDFGCFLEFHSHDRNFDECSVSLTEDEFEFAGATYRWTQFLDGAKGQSDGVGLSDSTPVPPDSPLRRGKMLFGDVTLSLDDPDHVGWYSDREYGDGFNVFHPSARGVQNWVEGQKVPLNLQAKIPQAMEDETPPGSIGNVSDATLSALTVSDGSSDVPLTPAFASATAGYAASVDNSVGSVTVTPTVNDPNATVTVEGSAVTSGTASAPISLTAGTPKDISVVVTAQDGTANAYALTVTRAESSDATLKALTVSDGSSDVPLAPAFASATAGYAASVGSSVGSVTVTPTVNDPNATVTVEGSEVTSGTASAPISLTAGTSKDISVMVTAQNGTSQTYTLTVTIAPSDNDGADPTSQSQVSVLFVWCQQYARGGEGLRVCEPPYEGEEAVLVLALPSPAPANGTTVTLATHPGQTATSDDYTMPSTITIEEGERFGLITIAITDDDEDEGDESIYIYACISTGCDPLNPKDGEKAYNHGITIPGTRVGGV